MSLVSSSLVGSFMPNEFGRLFIEQAVISRLGSDDQLSDLVGSRMYPGSAPEQTPVPYIVWLLVSATTDYAHDGENGREHLFQFSVFGTTYGSAAAIRERLMDLLSGYRGPMGEFEDVVVLHSGTRHVYEPATKLHHISLDFTVTV